MFLGEIENKDVTRARGRHGREWINMREIERILMICSDGDMKSVNLLRAKHDVE